MLANYVYIVTGIGKRKLRVAQGLSARSTGESVNSLYIPLEHASMMPTLLAGLLTNHNYNSFCHVFMYYPSANIDTILITFQ